jgi:hypothetical protein
VYTQALTLICAFLAGYAVNLLLKIWQDATDLQSEKHQLKRSAYRHIRRNGEN